MLETDAQQPEVAQGLRGKSAAVLVRIVTSENVVGFFPLIIAVVAFLGFLPTLGNGFIEWRDKADLIDNPLIEVSIGLPFGGSLLTFNTVPTNL